MPSLLRAGVAAGIGLAALSSFAGSQANAPHRAILVSYDGFSEQRFREYADSATAPHVWAMFGTAVCAESVRPAFPSVTPTGHAAIWTGAYANVNGVSGSANSRLPLTMTSVLESADGYRATALRAEPIWITAARQGKSVYSHMATQSPQPPAYIPVVRPVPELDSARRVGMATMAGDNIAALNVYNELVAPARVVTSVRELSWAFGVEGDSLHATIRDDNSVVVHANADRRNGVVVRLAATDTTPIRGRALARHFSPALRVDLRGGRRTFVFFRLFELPRDRSRLMLFVSEARVVQANRPEIAESYDAQVQGLIGNAGGRLMEAGLFGPRASQGGDGTAEFRYLETTELLTRQFLRGTEWGWKTYHPELVTDYLPYPDEALHVFLGLADPATPNVSPAGRANARRMLARAYALMDLHLERLQRLAASTPNTRLFVTGEHGMRPAWLVFKPNVLLREMGMLDADTTGRIILRRTRATFSSGGWVVVNRATRKNGAVPADSAQPILDRIEAALLAVRDSAGTHVVPRVFRTGTVEGDSLGIGGPGGGDLYFSLAPGYYWNAGTLGPMVDSLMPQGEHGYPSIDRDMHPALCIIGGGQARRIGDIRSIDIAPSVAEWLGIAPPGNAEGTSILSKPN